MNSIFSKLIIIIIISSGIHQICGCDKVSKDKIDPAYDVPDWPGRKYLLHLPANYNNSNTHPLVLILHGGGQNKKDIQKRTCPNGILGEPGCLDSLADQEGYIVAYPDGTPLPTDSLFRSYNVGGGSDGWECLYSTACENDVDDVAYFSDLIDHLKEEYNINNTKIYCGGYSTGAGMCHRLACELSGKIAAIGSIAGANHFETTETCSPDNNVSIIAFHGLSDQFWPFKGGKSINPNTTGKLYAVYNASDDTDTMRGWADRNGCSSTSLETEMPDTNEDGTTVIKKEFTGCGDGAEVILYEINSGGHTWPDGWDEIWYFGKVSRDISASQLMLDFFTNH